MRIIVDAMGGDNAPDAAVRGAVDAAKEFGVDITLCGDPQAIGRCIGEAGASADGDDALPLSIQKVSGWRLSRCYLVTDLSVLLLSLSYIPVTSIVYSLITVFISSPLIDVIVGMGSDEPANEPQVA